MKRDREFIELTEDEWSRHSDSFRPSRVLNSHPTSRNPPPPPIESFAFSKTLDEGAASSAIEIIESSSSEDGVGNGNRFKDLEDEDADVRVSRTVARGNRFVVDDDEDDGLKGGEFSDDEEWFGEVEKEEKQEVRRTVTRGNRVVIDDDDEDDGSADLKGGEFSDDEEWFREEVKAEKEDEDVVKKALRKCEKISAELKRELYGTTSAVCDRYSEVEMGSSAARIVNQDDVNEACGSEDSEFKPILKPYQLIGVNFLLLLYRKKIGGAILADEMGLGKTVQAITYLTLLKHLEDDPGPHLIVCPASVLENWERELKRWCPTFTVLQYHGSTRSAYSRELSSLAKAGLPPPFDVILVCYSIFERHSLQQKEDRKVLRQWKWSCVLMDEAHALKDKNSYRWKNLMSVARNARQRLMLTGTPLQNDLHELWSMLEFIMPDLFETGDVDLKKLLNAEDRDLISRMKSILGPFILRRLKSDVMQQLVPKMQKIEYVRMEKQQEDTYKEAIENYRAISQARMKSAGTGSKNGANVLPRRQISNYFLEFRKIANHPLLVRRIYTDNDVVRFAKMLHPKGVFGFECTLDRVIEELKSYNDFSIHRLLLYYGDPGVKGMLSDEHVMFSGKCRALAGLLPALNRSGNRVLIFSQWTSMLDILANNHDNSSLIPQSPNPIGLFKGMKIYVYDLPSKYNADWLTNERCSSHLFAAEVAIHRGLMESEDLRTLDPWEADFFFLPIYVACNFSTVNGFPAIGHARKLIASAVELVSSQFPFWNRSNGADHVFVASHDFGSCFHTLEDVAIDDGVPKILRNSIVLQTFGVKHKHPCQAVEHVVIPPYIPPESVRKTLEKSPITGRRDIFAFFRGKMELHPKNVSGRFYSKRVRTEIWRRYSSDRRFYLRRNRFAGYQSEIVRSTFCLCPLGWAPWSPRLVESVALGCVPVIVADGIRLPFQAAVPWGRISLTVAEGDVGRLGNILEHVAATNLSTIQKNLWDPLVRRALLYNVPILEGDATWQVMVALSGKLARSHRRLSI